MQVNLEELANRYAVMDDDDFAKVEWKDLTEEAWGVYGREFQRRKPSEWDALAAQRAEYLRQVALAENTRKESLLSTYGRLNRQSYVLRLIGINVVVIGVAYAAGYALGMTMGESAVEIAPIVGLAIGIAGTVVAAFQAVKRFHDLDRPGTHFWLLLIPIYGLYIGLVLLFKKGTDGPNQFGNDPLAKLVA
jgi:uncharacterized membrane protein YhaH (DUF805 family)